MSSISSVTVTVPATTANLGPGFDCIGAALSLHNEFKFTALGKSGFEEPILIINATGSEASKLTNDESSLVYQAFIKLYKFVGEEPPSIQIDIALGVPLARGLGSSATAIVGGLIGANELAGSPLTQLQLMNLAIEMEGHPDNVVPALLGGCRLAATGVNQTNNQTNNQTEADKDWVICEIPWNQQVLPIVAIPDFELETREARRVLPTEFSRADAIFNTAHLGLLLRGLDTANGDWLRAALQDKLHQPYRKGLINGYDVVSNAAINAGAFGLVISGAGPTLLALTDGAHSLDVVAAMATAWKKQGIAVMVRSLSLDTQGAKVIHNS
jgi:homoserine kinase